MTSTRASTRAAAAAPATAPAAAKPGPKLVTPRNVPAPDSPATVRGAKRRLATGLAWPGTLGVTTRSKAKAGKGDAPAAPAAVAEEAAPESAPAAPARPKRNRSGKRLADVLVNDIPGSDDEDAPASPDRASKRRRTAADSTLPSPPPSAGSAAAQSPSASTTGSATADDDGKPAAIESVRAWIEHRPVRPKGGPMTMFSDAALLGPTGLSIFRRVPVARHSLLATSASPTTTAAAAAAGDARKRKPPPPPIVTASLAEFQFQFTGPAGLPITPASPTHVLAARSSAAAVTGTGPYNRGATCVSSSTFTRVPYQASRLASASPTMGSRFAAVASPVAPAAPGFARRRVNSLPVSSIGTSVLVAAVHPRPATAPATNAALAAEAGAQ
ncbi:hypothetical protein H9P43_005583 [Blastocladiella emersonii ATCC 22665]|nr:hypothetical protein H9P43_005583 [Blastocladiella emersonii ATCC 22665]